MHASLGFALAVIGGLLMGSFSLPMKKTTKWAWETTWLVWAAVALVVTPWVIALNTVPDPLAVYREAGVGTLARVFLFGAGWGLGAVLFGQSIALLGMSLAFALSIGLTMALGALVPILSEPHLFLTPGGKALAAGVVVMLLGVAISALAGRQKERQAQAAAAGVTPKGSFVKGLTLCILSGIFNPMINFAYTFSDRIREAADAHGASAGGQSDAVWTITLLGGFATNLVYCSILLYRNRTWSGYRLAGTGSYWFLAAVMGATWMVSFAIYGRAAGMMGELGSSAGWAITMGCCILASNVWGIVTGEWRKARGKPLRTMVFGLAVILLAIAIIGYGKG